MKVYQFEKFKDFFEYQLSRTKAGKLNKRRATLQELAERLGYSSPSLLSMVASGARLPSDSLLDALFKEWDVNPREQERIRLKVEIEKRKRKGLAHVQLIEDLNRLSPHRNYKKIELGQFKLIKDWFVLVIKLMAQGPNFNPDPTSIARRLRGKITATEAKNALQTLVDTGYLKHNPESGSYSTSDEYTETTHDIPSEAIQENHRGMLHRALDALTEQAIDQRHFNSLSLHFDDAEMPRAKQKILDFIKDFNAEFGENSGDRVYQLNIQFFEHTKKEDAYEN